MSKPVTLHGCTVVARNYLALARVVASTFLEQHADGRFVVLLLDDVDHEVEAATEPFEVWRPADIMSQAQFSEMAATYNVLELATAVKPWLLRRMLDTGATTAAYLDPDLCFYRPIGDVFVQAAESGIALTPHTITPVPRDNRTPTEQYLLQAGVFNLGFIVVSEQATDFLDWWCERLRTDCIIDPANGLFVDQRWIDLVPGYFSHAIVRDSTLNVAYWNLGNRSVEERGSDVVVDGRSLRFFHFSGFDPSEPDRLSKHDGGRPRYDLAALPAVQRLCHDYGRRLAEAGHDDVRHIEYALDRLPDGSRLDDRMRRLYRQEVNAADRPSPPNPWERPQAFRAWLQQPAADVTVSRYLQVVYEDRPDVQVAYPDLARDPEGFFEWVRVSGAGEEGVPAEMVPQPANRRRGSRVPLAEASPQPATELGVVVAGYFRAEMGVGEAGRRIITTLEASDVPYATYTYDRTVVRQQHPFEDLAEQQRFPIALVCVNADQTPNFARDVGSEFLENRYTIGQWFWEVDVFPDKWADAFEVVDEIWAGSEHIARALRPLSSVPVVTVPLPIEVPDRLLTVRKDQFGLEDRFTYLFAFDFLSIFERKNPLAVVDAFRRAFPAPGESQLVLKTTNASRFPEEAERLRSAIVDRDDVTWIDEYLTRERQQALMHASDAYVSLHRSEGFGLTMAEAMAVGKPVVATGYSGNLDFMTDETSLLVPYTLRPVGHGHGPYPAKASWAEPDIKAAAGHLRCLFDDQEFARELGERARGHLLQNHTAAVRGVQVRERLETILRTRPPSERKNEPNIAPRADVPPSVPRDLPDRIERLSLRGYSHSPSLGALTDWTRSGTERLLYPFMRDLRDVLSELHRSIAGIQDRNEAGLQETAAVASEAVDVVEPLRRKTTDLAARVDEVAQTAECAESANNELIELRAEVARLRAEMDAQRGEMDKRLEPLLAGHGTLADGVAANDDFKRGASRHLEGLTSGLERLSSEFARLRSQVEATPYMAPESPIGMVPDPIYGSEAMGFRGAADRGNYEDFEDVFRGPRELIRERARFYVPLLESRAPVVDLGCGRGELLELLAEAGVDAGGVDSDDSMVRSCQERGLAVTKGDALAHLLDNAGRYGAIVATHFVEHIPTDTIMTFMRAAHEALQPGGILLLETVNPNAISGLKTFWVDLTHVHPIFPEVALELARISGFEQADVVMPDFADSNQTGLGYEGRLVSQGEYAVIATKCVPPAAQRSAGPGVTAQSAEPPSTSTCSDSSGE